jgi:predicted RNase H-like HicB family nuclease
MSEEYQHMQTIRISLRIVFYYEQDRWIAHCLEFDLMGDGDTQPEALESLSEAISLQVDASLVLGNPENLFTPAEGKFFCMFAQGKNAAAGELKIKLDGVEIESEDMREFAEEHDDSRVIAG